MGSHKHLSVIGHLQPVVSSRDGCLPYRINVGPAREVRTKLRNHSLRIISAIVMIHQCRPNNIPLSSSYSQISLCLLCNTRSPRTLTLPNFVRSLCASFSGLAASSRTWCNGFSRSVTKLYFPLCPQKWQHLNIGPSVDNGLKT